MIELQWVKREKVYMDDEYMDTFTENVLQYRYSTLCDGMKGSSPWTDVPIVDETVNQDD